MSFLWASVLVLPGFILPARADPVRVRVGGAPAVLAAVRTASGAGTGVCNDAGEAPDEAVDGVVTCLVDVPGTTGEVFVFTPSERIEAGTLTWTGARDANVRVENGLVSLSASVPPSPVAAPGAPVPARALVLVAVAGAGPGPAPVLAAGDRQLACRDDGQFPDRARNDGEPTCVGVLDPGSWPAAVQGKDGARVSVGTIDLSRPGLYGFKADLSARTLTADAALGPLPDASTASGTSGTGDPGGDPAGAPPGGAGVGAAPATDLRGILPLAGVLLAGAGGFALARARRRRRRASPPGLRPHAAPALIPGGPTPGDPSALLRADDPDALYAFVATALAGRRRLVLVAEREPALPPLELAWWSAARNAADLVVSLGAFRAQDGPPVAVLVRGAAAVVEAGAVNPDGLRVLVEGAPRDAWILVVAGPDEAAPAWLPTWRVAGPPWVATRA